jgi:hypothetical protein
MVSECMSILVGVAYIAMVYLADWAIDKIWWWYIDKKLEGRNAVGVEGYLTYTKIDEENSLNELGHPEVNPAETVDLGSCKSCDEIA